MLNLCTSTLVDKIPTTDREPLGLNLDLIEERQTIRAKLKGILVEVKILQQVSELTPWLYHVLISSTGTRSGEELNTFPAIFDSPISKVFTDQASYSIELIETLTAQAQASALLAA